MTPPTTLQHLITTRQGQLSRRAAARQAHLSPDLLSDIAHGIPRACRISTLVTLATWLDISGLDMLVLYMEHYNQCQDHQATTPPDTSTTRTRHLCP